MRRISIRPLFKPAVFLLCLLPLASLAWRGASGGLGANPVEALVRGLGDWALWMLLAALAVTPLRQVTGWGWIARQRRLVGLFAFAYALLHLLAYAGVDQFFDWRLIAAEIVKRRFILVGMATLLILSALAATSTDEAVRRLGGRRWRKLHRLVYAAGALAVLHHFMMVKADTRPPLIEGGILACLLGWRLIGSQKMALKTREKKPRDGGGGESGEGETPGVEVRSA